MTSTGIRRAKPGKVGQVPEDLSQDGDGLGLGVEMTVVPSVEGWSDSASDSAVRNEASRAELVLVVG